MSKYTEDIENSPLKEWYFLMMDSLEVEINLVKQFRKIVWALIILATKDFLN